MAAKHVNKAVVVSLDIKEFFHTIKQTRLQQLYQNLGIGEAPARTLSELCTFKAFVPQGAITSPKLSNVIAAITFGPTVKAYCDGRLLTLTIYADDITMSSDDPKLNYTEVISQITDIVNTSGFRINTKKTKVMKKHQRQYVCGVVVNEKTNLIKKERLRLRAIVHNVKINGPEHEALKSQVPVDHFIDVLRGKINWYTQLRPDKAKNLSAELTEALKLHKQEDRERKATVSATIDVGIIEPLDMQPWTAEEMVTVVQAPLTS